MLSSKLEREKKTSPNSRWKVRAAGIEKLREQKFNCKLEGWPSNRLVAAAQPHMQTQRLLLNCLMDSVLTPQMGERGE